MEEPFTAVGLRIKALRGDLSLREFAAKLGVDHKSVSGWEAGKRLPDGSSLVALMERFNADVNYILTGKSSGYAVARPPSALMVAEPSPAYAKNKEEEALLDNYRNSPPEGQSAIRTTSAALAKPKSAKDKRGKAA